MQRLKISLQLGCMQCILAIEIRGILLFDLSQKTLGGSNNKIEERVSFIKIETGTAPSNNVQDPPKVNRGTGAHANAPRFVQEDGCDQSRLSAKCDWHSLAQTPKMQQLVSVEN